MFPEILSAIKGKRILVIGDVIRDKYIFGRVDRLSPEAPVPVFVPEREEDRPGGAGNVSENIGSLGADCWLFYDIFRIIRKTRYVALPYNQQLLRVDYEEEGNKITPADVIEFAEKIIDKVCGVIISDYGKGLITPELLEVLLPYLESKGKPVMVDPSVKYFCKYQKVACMTPNLSEAAGGMGRSKPTNQKHVEGLGFDILEKLNLQSLLITQGADGMTLFTPKETVRIPAVAHQVFDVTGAGDTVTAALTLAYASGFSLEESAKFASACAGVVVGKIGTSTVAPEEILNL